MNNFLAVSGLFDIICRWNTITDSKTIIE